MLEWTPETRIALTAADILDAGWLVSAKCSRSAANDPMAPSRYPTREGGAAKLMVPVEFPPNSEPTGATKLTEPAPIGRQSPDRNDAGSTRHGSA